tara:strand:- start:1367 stop:1621 length:255 start_codon:yes stop_codon:yes gene_type:complete
LSTGKRPEPATAALVGSQPKRVRTIDTRATASHSAATEWSLMSDSADATQLPSFGLTAWPLVDKLVADSESRHPSANAAETLNA